MKTFLKNRYGQLLFVSIASVGSAYAAVPTEVSSAITDTKTDASTVGAAVLVVIVAIAAFKYIRKAL